MIECQRKGINKQAIRLLNTEKSLWTKSDKKQLLGENGTHNVLCQITSKSQKKIEVRESHVIRTKDFFQLKQNKSVSEDNFYRAIKLRKVIMIGTTKLEKTINVKLRGVK